MQDWREHLLTANGCAVWRLSSRRDARNGQVFIYPVSLLNLNQVYSEFKKKRNRDKINKNSSVLFLCPSNFFFTQVAGIVELTNRIGQISQLINVIGQFHETCDLRLRFALNVEWALNVMQFYNVCHKHTQTQIL